MLPYTPQDVMLFTSASLAVFGMIFILTGFFLLVRKAAGREVQTIATQTASLAQKGLAEDIAGLVGNARSLIEALNQLVRTTAGIGIFLVVSGFIMLLASFLLVRQI
jgi:hypothetical protein